MNINDIGQERQPTTAVLQKRGFGASMTMKC